MGLAIIFAPKRVGPGWAKNFNCNCENNKQMCHAPSNVSTGARAQFHVRCIRKYTREMPLESYVLNTLQCGN